MKSRLSTPHLTVMAFGYAFLYIPIFVLIAYSFNGGDRVMVWEGLSLRWYGELFRNEQIISAALLSFRIAAINATGATILGLMAAYILTRFKRFKGRTLFTGMVTAPLVVPEVITGLSLLLLFVALSDLIGWPKHRGSTTIIISHIVFSMAYVTVVVRARLASLDMSVEEAAMDLGARPWKVFLQITIPMLMPALISGWLLAFTISLDDLVISAFVTGPGASTLPMVIFSKVRLGLSPEINALATLLITLIATIVISALVLNREKASESFKSIH